MSSGKKPRCELEPQPGGTAPGATSGGNAGPISGGPNSSAPGSTSPLSRRQLFSLFASAALVSVSGWSRPSQASTLRALSLAELTQRSALILAARPVDYFCSWATLGGQRRIVTTTRILHEEVWLQQEENISESLVMTWGGRVGDIAQKVHGEAQLRMEEPCLVFLSTEQQGARRILGMSQGHFLIQGEGSQRYLLQSPQLPLLFPHSSRTTPASRELHQVSLTQARKMIQRLAP